MRGKAQPKGPSTSKRMPKAQPQRTAPSFLKPGAVKTGLAKPGRPIRPPVGY